MSYIPRCRTACLFLLLVAPSIRIAHTQTNLRQPATAPGQARTRNATDFPGVSIAEQLQAAIKDCDSAPCSILIPPGNYDTSPISTWKLRDGSGLRVGVLIPSSVEIRGSGQGITNIRVTRAASDPAATLFSNPKPTNQRFLNAQPSRNIALRNMSISWNDSSETYDWVSIFICQVCDRVELDHLDLEGNPNKLVNLLDNTHADVHDCTFSLRSTGYGHGDNALSVNRFDAAAAPGDAGVVRDNRFLQIGHQRTFSMLIVAQSWLEVHSNVFEAHLPPPGNGTAIETGQDNLGRLPENVKISENIFHGTSIAYGGLNHSEISGNFFDHGDIYVALQTGTTSSVSGLTISGNELHFGSINIGGLEHTSTGRFVIAGNRVLDGSIRTSGSSIVQDIEVSGNLVRYSSNMAGIDCNACSLIRGNVVREIGQNAPSDVHAGYLIGGVVQDVSNNVYLDEQHEYDAGTICTVAKPSSTLCMSSGRSSETSRWIRLQGGEWGFGWTNRTLFTDRGHFLIHAFVNGSLLELEENDFEKNAPLLPAGTHYHLYRTTFNAFELNSATIERFANNLAISAVGFRHAAVQENGTVRIRSLSGNVFHPYSCVGKCTVDYRSSVTPPE